VLVRKDHQENGYVSVGLMSGFNQLFYTFQVAFCDLKTQWSSHERYNRSFQVNELGHLHQPKTTNSVSTFPHSILECNVLNDTLPSHFKEKELNPIE